MRRDVGIELLQAIAVTAELTGTELSEAAARILADDLAGYPLAQVLAALTRCRRELHGRLTVAAVVERLDDGRPGAEEAWAMVPQDERASVVWTQEMAEAFGVAGPLLTQGDHVAARMAFRESYAAAVARARAAQEPPKWFASLGHDPAARRAALDDAVRKGRIDGSYAASLLPAPETSNVLMLTGPRSSMPEKVRRQLREFATKVGGNDGRARGDHG